jgi:hypothetical protein
MLTALTLSISVPGQFYNKKTFVALLSLPYGFILMVISLLKIKGASKKFIHTTHSIEGNTVKKGSNKTSH